MSPIDNTISAESMLQCMRELFPLHRSLTGEGVRETFRYLQRWLPWETTEVASGAVVLDWTIPQEWRIRDAFIASQDGERIVDYHSSNLQVLAYSQPISGTFNFEQLRQHLHVDLQAPTDDAVPYRTSYFRKQWGFCVSRNQWARLTANPDEEFDVRIEAEFFDGSLTYGESQWNGDSSDTILVYAHCCHPSLANDNLSGMVIATFIGMWLRQRLQNGERLAKSYRIVIAPATLGAIAWLDHHRLTWNQICGGLVLSLLADRRPFTYKMSRQGNSVTDRAVAKLGRESRFPIRTLPFRPFGYDERQFCSPGVNLPVGCLMRSSPDEFEAYHTSDDNLETIQASDIRDSLELVQQLLWTIEQNCFVLNSQPYGEPQLGRYDLYRAYGESNANPKLQEALMWVLNLADGEHDLLSIAERSDLPFSLIVEASDLLRRHQLVQPIRSTGHSLAQLSGQRNSFDLGK